MSGFRLAPIVLGALASSLMAGCESPKPPAATQAPTPEQKLVLKSVGPVDIKAGVKFNVQPNGESAIWLVSEGATPKTIPVLSGVELSGVNVPPGGALVTAIVPAKMISAPGAFPIYLVDKSTGVKSNSVDLIVK
jgi:hypothetical protein